LAPGVAQALKRGLIFNDLNGTNKFVPFPNLLEHDFFRNL
jgi:hypothetical protein